MSRIRGRDTTPEMVVRRLVHGLEYRFRLHVRSLPGAPDLVFPARKKVIFVHGCFWHRHTCPLGRPMPATRREFWQAKLEGNRDLATPGTAGSSGAWAGKCWSSGNAKRGRATPGNSTG